MNSTIHPALLAGAQPVRTKPGFTGLMWSPVGAALGHDGREVLRELLVPAALEIFDGTSEKVWQQWLSDDSVDSMQGLVVVLDPEGAPAAWVASNRWELDGRTCFYANSAGVHPRHQGAGLSSTIWRALLAPEIRRAAPRRLYAVTRTGNPLVHGAWSSAAGGPSHAYPSPGRRPTQQVRRIAAAAAHKLGQLDRFDSNTLIVRDAYDFTEAGLWTQRPSSDQTETERWFATTLGPRDAFIVVVTFDPVTIILGEAIRTLRLRLGLGTGGTSRSSRGR
ncbi:GNAT family N-acetyltransferase [Lolliginicoccus suaedae]|uniref:GNAT family N-acetyltransferase n=1 Tax=Lolliginicoccus suaedae TaxID=2605429 RepID=UPI0011EDDA72|nr:GNAT family N-acetyltransferase [Lolliginicoccus suaedae]